MTHRRIAWGHLVPVAILLWLLIGLLGHISAAPSTATEVAVLATHALLVAAATRYTLAIIRNSRKERST